MEFNWFERANIFEKFDENWFKFDLFNSTQNIRWSQIFINWIRLKLVRFDLKIYNSNDLKGETIFEKFDKNHFKIDLFKHQA